MKPRKFLFVGDGRYSNRGCEAIVRGTVEILSRAFPQARYILSPFGNKLAIDAASEMDNRIMHISPRNSTISRFTAPWWKYRLFLRAFPELQQKYQFGVQLAGLKESDCALMLGGDNLSLDYGIPMGFIQLDNALLSTGKPLVIWGASIGPFTKNPKFENIIKKHLHECSLICARETETVTYLAALGVEKNVRLVADPAFLMPAKRPHLTDELAGFIDQRPMGLNFSQLIGHYKSGYHRDKWVEEAAECIKKLVDSGNAPVLLVPHVMDEFSNDYEFLLKAVEKGPGWNDSLKILPPNLSAAEYKWCISKLQIFAGSRTHSTIAALSSRVPTISIGYSMKARGINKDIFGHLNWMMPINDLNPGSLLAKTEELLSCEKSVRLELEGKIPEIERRALSAADYVAEILK